MSNTKSKNGACPICSQAQTTKYHPFCSKRCADIDLNRWLTGQYAIPVEEEEPDDDAFQSLPEPQADSKLKLN